MALQIILLPLVSALLGVLAAFIAVKLLFVPRIPVRIGKWVFLGLVRRYWNAVVNEALAMIERDILSREAVDNILNQNDFEKELRPLFEERLDAFVDGMKKKNPVIAMFLSDGLLNSLKGQAREQFLQLFPHLKERAVEGLLRSPELLTLVEKKLRYYDLSALEARVWKQIIGPVMLYGGTAGLLSGIIQGALCLWLK